MALGALTTLCIGASAAAKTPESQVPTQKGKVRSDGTLMPGLPEAIAVAKFPPRAKIVLMITPAPGSNQCFVGAVYCAGGPVARAPGTRRFRTSGKGRALTQAIPPSEYVRQKAGSPAETFAFQDGDRVLIEVFASSRDRRPGRDRTIVGFASSPAVISIPPAIPVQ